MQRFNLELSGLMVKHRPQKLGGAGSISANSEIFSCFYVYLRFISF